MAGRKDKNTVDYFPHFCESGKTIFILENTFGHKGYSAWFKTLELLGSSENHYIDLRNETDLLFLISKLKITEQELIQIYDLLSKLDAIDKWFWSKKIVYSENFIKNIGDAYKRRSNLCMNKCDLCKYLFNLCNGNDNKCMQESTKERKGKENKVKENNEYTYDEFYDNEFKTSNEDKNYKVFIGWLFGDNYLERPLTNVLSMREQMNFKQFQSFHTQYRQIIDNSKIVKKPKVFELLIELEDWLVKDKKNKLRTLAGMLRTFMNRSISNKY